MLPRAKLLNCCRAQKKKSITQQLLNEKLREDLCSKLQLKSTHKGLATAKQLQRSDCFAWSRLCIDVSLFSSNLYSAFIEEYLNLGHHAENLEVDVFPNCYLQHLCVLKEDNSTTQLRLGIDSSLKTTTGVSLNEGLRVCPKVQEGLFDILLRFRFFKVAMSADIAKLYRQVKLCKKDKDSS